MWFTRKFRRLCKFETFVQPFGTTANESRQKLTKNYNWWCDEMSIVLAFMLRSLRLIIDRRKKNCLWNHANAYVMYLWMREFIRMKTMAFHVVQTLILLELLTATRKYSLNGKNIGAIIFLSSFCSRRSSEIVQWHQENVDQISLIWNAMKWTQTKGSLEF